MSAYRLKGTSGAVINQSFTLGDLVLIGAGESCDITVEADGLAGPAAEITVREGHVLLVRKDEGPGVFVNGEPVSNVELGSGDEIRIGTNRFIVQAPGLRPDRVLTADVVSRRKPVWPWIVLAALAAGVAFAWYQGLLPLP